jgi:hypothetical protein
MKTTRQNLVENTKNKPSQNNNFMSPDIEEGSTESDSTISTFTADATGNSIMSSEASIQPGIMHFDANQQSLIPMMHIQPHTLMTQQTSNIYGNMVNQSYLLISQDMLYDNTSGFPIYPMSTMSDSSTPPPTIVPAHDEGMFASDYIDSRPHSAPIVPMSPQAIHNPSQIYYYPQPMSIPTSMSFEQIMSPVSPHPHATAFGYHYYPSASAMSPSINATSSGEWRPYEESSDVVEATRLQM